jgi:hypothetical protein
LPLMQDGVRERAAALLTGSGVVAKVATVVATVALIAGGAVATHVLDRPPTHHPHHITPSAAAPSGAISTPAQLISTPPVPLQSTSAQRTVHTPKRAQRSSPGRVLTSTHQASRLSAARPREPGGFSYLGVPTQTSAPASAAEPAHTATHSRGGPFSP